MPTPLVIDLSHYNTVRSFADVKRAGIVGVIHKCTEGTTWSDDKYVSRKPQAIAAGLCWLSYHFLKHGNIPQQMEWYLKNVMPVEGERVCIDFEDAACTLDDLEEAVRYLDNFGLNLQVTVYSGHLVEQFLGNGYNEILSETSLWTAQYGSAVSWAEGTWPVWTLWQYTDQGKIAGIDGACDLNAFNGSAENCVKWMQPAGTIPEPEPKPEPEVFIVGDVVRVRATAKGARFTGVVISAYNSLSGIPHADVEATADEFEGTIHVYPSARLEKVD